MKIFIPYPVEIFDSKIFQFFLLGIKHSRKRKRTWTQAKVVCIFRGILKNSFRAEYFNYKIEFPALLSFLVSYFFEENSDENFPRESVPLESSISL